jgi:hypothetical protein
MRQSQPPWECMGARCCGSGRRLTNGWQSSPFPHLAWKDINAPKASSPPNRALIDRHRRVGYVLYIYKHRAFRSLPGARSLAIVITHASAFEQPDTLGANASAQSHGARPLARFAGLCWGQPIAGVFRQAWLRAQRHIPTWRPELSNANEQKAPEKKQRQKENQRCATTKISSDWLECRVSLQGSKGTFGKDNADQGPPFNWQRLNWRFDCETKLEIGCLISPRDRFLSNRVGTIEACQGAPLISPCKPWPDLSSHQNLHAEPANRIRARFSEYAPSAATFSGGLGRVTLRAMYSLSDYWAKAVCFFAAGNPGVRREQGIYPRSPPCLSDCASVDH